MKAYLVGYEQKGDTDEEIDIEQNQYNEFYLKLKTLSNGKFACGQDDGQAFFASNDKSILEKVFPGYLIVHTDLEEYPMDYENL